MPTIYYNILLCLDYICIGPLKLVKDLTRTSVLLHGPTKTRRFYSDERSLHNIIPSEIILNIPKLEYYPYANRKGAWVFQTYCRGGSIAGSL